MALPQCPVAMYTTVELYSEVGWLTAIVQYDDALVSDAMRTVKGLSVTVRDEDREYRMVDKHIFIEVVRHSDEGESPSICEDSTLEDSRAYVTEHEMSVKIAGDRRAYDYSSISRGQVFVAQNWLSRDLRLRCSRSMCTLVGAAARRKARGNAESGGLRRGSDD